MKIRNNSNKVIGVDNKYILPDQEGVFGDELKELPGIKALVKNGMLTITEDEKPVEKPVELAVEAEEVPEEPKEEVPEEPKEEVVEKPKRTRRKKEEVTE